MSEEKTPTTRAAKQKERRQVHLRTSTLGRGSPEYLGVELSTIKPGEVGRLSKSFAEWLKLLDNVVSEPGEWHNRKFYYKTEGAAPRTNTYISVAGIIKNNGVTTNKDKSAKELAAKVQDLSKVYGVEFDVAYTRELVKSDNPDKGGVMHVVFVRALKVRSPKAADILAVNSGERVNSGSSGERERQRSNPQGSW